MLVENEGGREKGRGATTWPKQLRTDSRAWIASRLFTAPDQYKVPEPSLGEGREYWVVFHFFFSRPEKGLNFTKLLSHVLGFLLVKWRHGESPVAEKLYDCYFPEWWDQTRLPLTVMLSWNLKRAIINIDKIKQACHIVFNSMSPISESPDVNDLPMRIFKFVFKRINFGRTESVTWMWTFFDMVYFEYVRSISTYRKNSSCRRKNNLNEFDPPKWQY